MYSNYEYTQLYFNAFKAKATNNKDKLSLTYSLCIYQYEKSHKNKPYRITKNQQNHNE
jgi:hypothetical protein